VSPPSLCHVYGPVPSRRLGLSLGVDLVPPKTCTYDCVYCQLGRTTCLTLERRQHVGVDALVTEVEAALARGATPDIVTLSGSGEPTLYRPLGELIAALRRRFRPVGVLTNGSLLFDPQVRAELGEADVVMPSLDAGDEATFVGVNRPHPELDLAKVVEGLVAFRNGYRGQLWLEVMLLAGLTGTHDDAAAIARLAARVRPDRVHLNTVVRPPAEAYAEAVPAAELAELAELFGPHAEAIDDRDATPGCDRSAVSRSERLALLRRRPCTATDVGEALTVAPNAAVKALDALLRAGEVELRRRGDRLFYVARVGVRR
jgi:wyosine [tRNA(Phe)-imidazoG37] synthetase (radical SAM superfamily)